jgi:hypothetical protein
MSKKYFGLFPKLGIFPYIWIYYEKNMLAKQLNRELAVWAEAGIRDPAFEYPPGRSVNSPHISAKPGGNRIGSIRNRQGEQLSLFKL